MIRPDLAFLAAGIAAASAYAQDTPTLGRQFAADSPITWEVRESVHPALGAIRFAYGKSLVVTQAGTGKIYSRAYVSCPKGSRKIAIELTNLTAPDDPAGLKPMSMPHLVCNRLTSPGSNKVLREELAATWETNEVGDMLARNLETARLRACISIDVLQDVRLPAGWGKENERVFFEVAPYNREVDSIFASCGEATAFAGAAPAAPAASVSPAAPTQPVAATPPAPPAAAAAKQAALPWRRVRVTSRGATNVRATASLDSAVVTQLAPGSVVEVQQTGNEWWRARSTGGARFEGYIRQDRLVFR